VQYASFGALGPFQSDCDEVLSENLYVVYTHEAVALFLMGDASNHVRAGDVPKF
jgi:hypothetical protein